MTLNNEIPPVPGAVGSILLQMKDFLLSEDTVSNYFISILEFNLEVRQNQNLEKLIY